VRHRVPCSATRPTICRTCRPIGSTAVARRPRSAPTKATAARDGTPRDRWMPRGALDTRRQLVVEEPQHHAQLRCPLARQERALEARNLVTGHHHQRARRFEPQERSVSSDPRSPRTTGIRCRRTKAMSTPSSSPSTITQDTARHRSRSAVLRPRRSSSRPRASPCATPSAPVLSGSAVGTKSAGARKAAPSSVGSVPREDSPCRAANCSIMR